MKRLISIIAALLTDIVSLILSFHLAYYLRVEIIQDLFHITNPWFFPLKHFYSMYYLLAVFILIFSYEKLYTYNRRYDFFEEFVFITRGLFMSVVLIAVIIYLSRSFEKFTRSIPLLMMLIGMVVVPLFRYLLRRLLIATGLFTRCAVVLGKKEETEAVLPVLRRLESRGWKILRVLEPDDDENNENEADRAETLIIVPHGVDNPTLNRLINTWENRVKEIKIVSDSSYLKTIGVEAEYIDELLVLRMANNLLSPTGGFLKRLFDLLVSISAAVVMTPLFLLIALLIKLDSAGPVLFVQERFGKGGKKFRFIKFRSMYHNSDRILEDYLKQNPQLQEQWDRYKKLKTHDPRVTRIGRILRRFSLDEAPQIINVVKGDMSIVGPRPYLIREKEEIEKSAAIIFRVKSGLTGLWQIKGRNELSFQARMKLDEFYVRNWSFMLDLTIILKTFGVVIRGKGAY